MARLHWRAFLLTDVFLAGRDLIRTGLAAKHKTDCPQIIFIA
jgi:hypothetical protein